MIKISDLSIMDYNNITYSLKYAEKQLKGFKDSLQELKIIHNIFYKIYEVLEGKRDFLKLDGLEIAHIKASLILFLERVSEGTDEEELNSNLDLAIESLYDTLNKF